MFLVARLEVSQRPELMRGRILYPKESLQEGRRVLARCNCCQVRRGNQRGEHEAKVAEPTHAQS